MTLPQSAITRSIMGKWALLATVFAVVVVMLGAWTRLMDAGLGCPDWPGCYGFLTVPESAETIALAEARFPSAPVDASKGWPEMIHRYFAGGLGLIILGLAVYAVAHRKEEVPLKLPVFLLFMVVLQAAFGMWTVTLKLWPQVVSAHLLGGFTTLTLLFLLTLRLRSRPVALVRENLARLRSARKWVVLATLAVIVQIALGAWVASNYAAVACTELPTCEGQWWPEMDFQHGFNIFQHVGPNYLGGQLHNEGRIAIHMSHRIGALAVLVLVLAALVALWRASANPRLRQGVVVSGILLILQIMLGLANIWLQLPISVAVAHNAGGAALLLSLVHLLYRLQPVSASHPETFSKTSGSSPTEAYTRDGSTA
jgi:cytochrome c oxidase assembly protein subunit 15